MRIVVAGGSGFLGRRLTGAWIAAGHEVTVLTRDPERAARRLDPAIALRAWDSRTGDAGLAGSLRGQDAVVNLAGATIGGRPWTPGRKRAIRDSRTGATGAIVGAIRALAPADRPAVLVNASGIDVYGDDRRAELTESDPPGGSFLAGVVRDWEAAAAPAADLGVRVVLARAALVVAPEAPAFRLVTLPFRLFVGGPLGGGEQPFTWIHVDDVCGLYDLALRDASLSGPLNVVAPDVPTQREAARTIGRVLGRPAIVPAPAALLRLVLWGQADILLHGRRAVPAKALGAGYAFRFPALEPALRDALDRPAAAT